MGKRANICTGFKRMMQKEGPFCSVEKSVRSQKVFRSKTVTETMTVRRRQDASRRSLHSVAKYLYDIEVSSSPFPPRRAIKPHASKIEMFDSETNPAPITDLQGRRSSNKETSVAEKMPKHAFFQEDGSSVHTPCRRDAMFEMNGAVG